jgi:DNA-binding transcriptional MocR family regulator
VTSRERSGPLGGWPWARLAGELLDQVEARDVKPGQLLPSIDVLRSEAGISSRQTVAKALQALEQRGILTRLPGKGYQVRPEGSTPPSAAALRLLTALRVAWDGIYMFSVAADGRFEAWRMDGTLTLGAATMEELRIMVRDDWPCYAAGTAL